jgi:hypothetical protein
MALLISVRLVGYKIHEVVAVHHSVNDAIRMDEDYEPVPAVDLHNEMNPVHGLASCSPEEQHGFGGRSNRHMW